MKMKKSRIDLLEPVSVDAIPTTLEPGILYICEKYRTASHLCCCGCGTKVATPLKPTFWSMTRNGDLVSLHPSVGNWSLPCRSHYVIEDNTVLWAGSFSDEEIAAVKARDSEDQDAYFNALPVKKGFWRRLVDWILGR